MNRKEICLVAVVLALMLLGSTCLAQENQIINGEFDAGTTLWQRYGDDAYTIEVVQGAGLSGQNALKIDIFDAVAQESITVAQGNLILEREATYHIGFMAKAEADRQMRVLLRQANTGVDAWYELTNLTISPQTFAFEYKHSATTYENMVLYFILKNPSYPVSNENENIDVYIDAVYLIEEPCPEPNLAHYPWPSDGAMYTETWICCSWTPGRHAVSHDVYFGDNYDDVYNGSGDTYWGNQRDIFFVYGFPDFTGRSQPLVPGTTYYWRIDEVNDLHPDSPWKGDVWSFWLPPITAYDPVPENGAELIDPNITLSWTAGLGAKLHYLYFGENLANVETGTGGTFKGHLSKTSYFPVLLEFDKTYYWRVDEFDGYSTYKGTVWSLSTKPAEPNIAHDPFPPDGAMYTDTWPIFSWSPGRHAVSHDVYIGENYDDVYNGTENTFSGNQTISFWTIGFPSFPYPSFLVPGTTYYWRIDEVNDLHPDSPWKGNIWSFWLPPYTAYDPFPVDEAELIDPNVTLSWTAGFSAKLHYLYFGENSTEVEAGTGGTFKNYLSETSYFPGPLEFDKTYYWRVDEYDGYATHKGKVWSFSTKPDEPNIAHDPIPADGAMYMDTWITCSWSPGCHAVTHDVYFGNDFDDVNNVDTSDGSGVYRGRSAETSYTPEVLMQHQVYYWRIDEVEADGLTIHKGNVWCFTVAEAETVIRQVSASEDDGYAFNPIGQNLQTTYLKIGYSEYAQTPYHISGMIFRNVNIPPGSVILSAHLKVRSYNSNQTGTVYARIEAEAVDNATGFTGSRRIDTLPTTSSSVDWTIEEPWSANMWYESPNIVGVIQEIIDRPGWSAGNSLAILLHASSKGVYRFFSSVDHNSDFAPILEIQY